MKTYTANCTALRSSILRPSTLPIFNGYALAVCDYLLEREREMARRI
jgi:hypothetical protein